MEWNKAFDQKSSYDMPIVPRKNSQTSKLGDLATRRLMKYWDGG